MPDRQPLPEHVTLPLLALITKNSLDEDYQHVADNKAAAGTLPAEQRNPRKRAAFVAGVFGLLIVTAGVQTSREAATAARGREELVSQINDRSDNVRELNHRIGNLRDENAALERRLASVIGEDRAASSRLLRLQGMTGYAAVRGPGVRLRVDDSPDGDSDGVVRDSDMALLVDALWKAGAEAIAINGERLTSLSGIRSVGRAIHVKTVPLKPPYNVLAIGDPNTLQARFAENTHGQEWYQLVGNFNFEFEMENADSLLLPRRTRPELRSATELELNPNRKEVTP